jgi:ribosomal protein L37AE/L43A
MSSALGERAWVFVMKSDAERSWAANRGYDDSAGIYYSYDSNVGNCKQVSKGDLIVVREDDHVAGWGFIEFIEVFPNSQKEISRCPKCNKTNFSRRKTISPANKCASCKFEFEDIDAQVTLETVTAYRAFYANTWTEAARPVFRTELEEIIKTRDTFNAIRPLDRDKLPEFLDTISGRDVDLVMDIGEKEVEIILGGHVEATVRRRRGQREFRFKLMERFGEICAFSGEQPPQVLEAAHINSFAQTGEHHLNGGLLLRRDIHSLFDANLISVNPESWKIQIAPRLQSFETYRPLNGRSLLVPEGSRPSIDLVRSHFDQSLRIFNHN